MSTPPDSSGIPLLHIFLLTYNREKPLRRTLEALASSPLRNCVFTIMDNCSTDGTAQVCEEFRPRFPSMEIHRHPRNIGFGANFLRSIERTRGEYTWILCDDDTFFPDRAGALLDLLESARPQACFAGGPRQEAWPAGLDVRPLEIQRRFGTFLTGQSFVPAVIFKSSLIGSRDLFDGYFGIGTHFPQMIIGRKLLIEDIPCAVLQPPILFRDIPTEKRTVFMEWVAGWSTFCRTLPPALRTDAFYSFFGQPGAAGMIRELLRTIACKIEGVGDPGYHLARTALNSGFSIRAALIVCRLACIVPRGVYTFARESYRKVKYGWLRRPLPPGYHAPITQDELRN